jgi:hypothetical protein
MGSLRVQPAAARAMEASSRRVVEFLVRDMVDPQ